MGRDKEIGTTGEDKKQKTTKERKRQCQHLKAHHKARKTTLEQNPAHEAKEHEDTNTHLCL